ncbi:hypothetical protein ETB97_009409 [Aspergillus alliaceus]|uniref:Enoyl reductase (ER) domain-containing protein n=1 Tax=Petromyces alliaceus TaxID=209559 RepID=A0A8H6E8U0_PETAA|nr:hypothetical protein ETB97_009409 [Aspergillus burnettii]
MSTTVPDSMRAVVGNRAVTARLANYVWGKPCGDGVKVQNVPTPTISDSEILVHVKAVALNPTDFKHVDLLAHKGAIIGCDFSGTVAKVGSNAPGNWKIGDRAAGWVHGGLYSDRGSFAEYLKVPADLAWKVPPAVSDEEASTYGVSAVTAVLALNARLDVPWADGGKEGGHRDSPVFIYAGATSAGLYAIQVAKLAGLKVVATASPRSHDLVKQYGADDVFDYRSPTAAEEIARAYPQMSRAMDCFSEGGSTDFCVKVVRQAKGKVITLLDSGKKNVDGVEVEFFLGYGAFNRPWQWLAPVGPRFSASPSDNAALRRFYSSLHELCHQLRPPPLKQIEGGLSHLSEGLDLLRQGKVAGTKLVARLD